MGSYKIQVPVIVNSNTAQVLVVTEIPLTPPAFLINEIHKLIEIDDSLSGQIVVREEHVVVAKFRRICRDQGEYHGYPFTTENVHAAH